MYPPAMMVEIGEGMGVVEVAGAGATDEAHAMG